MQPGERETGSGAPNPGTPGLGIARPVRPDFDALSALLKEHGPAVGRDLVSQFGRHLRAFMDVDDVMQVTYLEAFLRFSHFVPHGSGSFKRWLKQIARNNLRDAIRELRRSRRAHLQPRLQPVGDETYGLPGLEDFAASGSTPSRQAAGHERAEILRTVISRLPEDYQRVVQLCDLEGKAVSEAAAMLGRSQGAVHMLRARAHDRLRELLGSQSKFYSGGHSV